MQQICMHEIILLLLFNQTDEVKKTDSSYDEHVTITYHRLRILKLELMNSIFVND